MAILMYIFLNKLTAGVFLHIIRILQLIFLHKAQEQENTVMLHPHWKGPLTIDKNNLTSSIERGWGKGKSTLK